MIGIVKNVMTTRLFGFIRGESGVEYFFHKDDYLENWDDLVVEQNSAINGPIKVSFDVVEKSPKGPRASNVMRSE